MRILVEGFGNGGKIPAKFTCDGKDIPPEIRWADIPGEADSLAIVLDDPDAPFGSFTHWIVYNIPAGLPGIGSDDPDPGISQGINDYGREGYRGPCPPHGSEHMYRITLYALRGCKGLPERLRRKGFEASIRDHVVEEDVWMGSYSRTR